MKPLQISGHNDFYNGWLYAILGQELPEDAHEFAREGYRIAQETGLEAAATVLLAEIELKHIIVS